MRFFLTSVFISSLLVSYSAISAEIEAECIDNPNSPVMCAEPSYVEEKSDKRAAKEPQPTQKPSFSEQAQCVVVKGIASSKDVSEAFARKMAIRDALQQASLKNNVVVKTDQSVEAYQLTLDSARFTSSSKVKSFTVLKEGFEEPEDKYGATKKSPLNYEVTLNVCLTEERGVCPSLPGNQYQPRLAIAPVVFAHANQANDVSNLLNGYQLELERRVRNQGYKNYTLLNQVVDLQPNIQVSPNLDPELIAVLRDKTGAQYLLLTVIRSMSAHAESGLKNDVKRFYNLEVKPSSRYIETDWYMVDLMRNEIVHQSRGGFDVEGNVTVGRDKPFGSNAFFATDTGKVFHALLEQEVTDAIDYLHCKPFESEIIDVRGEEYIIYLNASSGAKVGDDLAVYHRTGRPVRFNGSLLGSDFVPGAFLKIKRIMPRFAVAELTAKKGLVQVGDVVKTW
ncbi:hypothetical protein THMIRHAM_07460 [Thiomicrorhabdus immobilis]|uniref:Flagellar assembly protein T middle domain-containing protein n=1 Tax=Thiomicrorhabdus immobilis TaxID=2791037 RepID=A0ABM7MC55_9GAMM|nr:hypothetical protein [Thiomicrorhabdus immobilis]BCN92961.1 hypothetical protein THMIRHAM_07460 [Thiomicrorhabdus immobilis]